jgi:hypothetical protein
MHVLMLLSSFGCSNSGLGQTTPTGDTAPTSAQDCPWVGTWALDEVKCSTVPYESWSDHYVSAEMEIDHDPAGGCAVQATLKADACEREEAWHFAVPVGTSVEVTFLGIQDCRPNRCVMEPGADECKNGELEGEARDMTVDDSTANTLQAVDLLKDTGSGCPLSLVTLWKKQ